jgi:hypothetical protein
MLSATPATGPLPSSGAIHAHDINCLASTITVVGLLLAYAIVTIGAGHGILPAGLMLLVGLGAPSWLPPVVTGWLGVLAAVASCFLANRPAYLAMFAVAVVSLTISLVTFIPYSEGVEFTLFTALPFAGMLVASVFRLLLAARGT